MSSHPSRLNELSAQGRVCKVFGVKSITSIELPSFAANAGFDGLFIDLEHSSFSLETANKLSVGCLKAGISPFVRVPGGVPRGFIQRVLDGGAQGVIFPHVDTVEQAQAAAVACKFPPTGKRSISGMLPQLGYKSPPVEETIALCDADHSSVFVMIESPEALDNIDAIAAVRGVDVIMVGTNDLSVEMGIPGQWDNPEYLAAMSKISKAAKANGKKMAIAGIYNRPDFIERCIHEYGASWIVLQHDLSMMSNFMSDAVKDFACLEASLDGKA